VELRAPAPVLRMFDVDKAKVAAAASTWASTTATARRAATCAWRCQCRIRLATGSCSIGAWR